MKKTVLTTSIFICLITVSALAGNGNYTQHFRMPDGIKPDDYRHNYIILKFNENNRNNCTEKGVDIPILTQYLNSIGGGMPEKMFPRKQKPERERNPQGIRYADLSLIYSFHYNATVPLEKVINRIYTLGLIQYAEPWYIPKALFTPNDPNLGFQAYLGVINAYSAWNTQQGDPNVVIGITDTGIDTNHPDLVNEIKYNTADPINSIDDDNDGYIDNYRGWDVAMNDNNPQWQANQHGVHVSGDASAETNNNTGVAAAGFNTKVLPVKISDNTGALIAAYQGITYAADHGCDIINCSWGGGGPSQFAQDVITYATINKDALVVAAAGNNSVEEDFYPASYQWVISVAATQNSDVKAPFSNYGVNVDVCAPGVNIYSTTNNSYGYMSGTSMASPVAAGAAAIIQSEYPSLNAIQVGEQLKVTCDNIDAQNPSYIGKLGNGRINMGTSVAGITQPSIIMTDRTVTDNNNDIFIIGDTLDIFGDYTNYLAASNSVTATLSTTDPYVSILSNSASLGVINTLQTVNNNANPFKVKILNTCPLNEVVTFKIHLDDGNYTNDIYFNVTVNVDYINIAINDVATTITSKSPIGWNDPPTLSEGLGFTYQNGGSQLYESGLMIGDPSRVSDYLRGDPQGNTDNDFGSIANVQKVPNIFSEFDVEGKYNDNPAGGQKLNVEVHHKGFAWTLPGHTKYVIVEYTITNTGGSALTNLYSGIFCDWDVMDYSLNHAGEDATRKLGYVWSNEPNSPYFGIRLLTADPWNHYAIDNDGSNGSINIYDGYPTTEKYTSLSTSRATAGEGDVADVVSAGPFTINQNDSITIAFAILAGDSLDDIKDVSDSAWNMYNNPCVSNNLQASGTSSDATCLGNNGSATATPVGGTSPYSYQWDANTGNQTTQTATSLAAGTYNVTITDGISCTKLIAVTVNSNNVNITNTTSSTIEHCASSDGSASVTPTSGTSPYTYQWSNGQTTQSATGLASGSYTVTITDNNGCTGTATVSVSGTPAVTGSLNSNDATCGQNDGDATVNVTGGTSPFNYQWDSNTGNQTSQTATGLGAGSYTCTVTDANSCTNVFSVNISNSGSPSITNTVVTNILCNGDGNGSIDITVTGGVTPYSYTWSSGATTEDINGLSGGVYTITITDFNNCIQISNITVTEPSAIATSDILTNVTCNGDADGSVDITVSGGTSPYNYSWSNGDTTEDINGLLGGTYTVTITDNNGCTDIRTYNINEPPAISISGSVVDNQTLGSIDLTVTGGTSPYSYSWIGPNSYTSTNEDLSGLTDQGTYIVTVSDSNGCTTIDSFIVAGIVVVGEISYNEISVKVIPNPSNGNFSLIFDGGNDATYHMSIINILGEIVYYEDVITVNGKENRFNFSELAPGIYFIKLSFNEINKSLKIVIR